MEIPGGAVPKVTKQGRSRVCVRRFSALNGLQPAHSIRYRLADTPEGWRLEIRQESGQTVKSVSLQLDATEEEAVSLFVFLYENGVPPEQAADILADLLPRVKWEFTQNRSVYEKGK